MRRYFYEFFGIGHKTRRQPHSPPFILARTQTKKQIRSLVETCLPPPKVEGGGVFTLIIGIEGKKEK
jgi:hypothetical protein